MIEYQYHKDRPIESQINRLKKQISKGNLYPPLFY